MKILILFFISYMTLTNAHSALISRYEGKLQSYNSETALLLIDGQQVRIPLNLIQQNQRVELQLFIGKTIHFTALHTQASLIHRR